MSLRLSGRFMHLSIVRLDGEGEIWELRMRVSSLFWVITRSPTEDDFAVDTIFRKKSLFSTQNRNWSYL